VSAKNEWGLTPQQEKFAQAVASGKSQVEAYRSAYPKSAKWKDEALRVAGAKMSAIANVSVRIKQIQAKGAEIAGLDAAKIAAEIAKVAHSDIGGIMDENGRVKLPHELDPATRAAVSSFKIDEYGRIEYKFWDKNTALSNAARITGMFEADNRQKGAGAAEFLAGLKSNVLGVVKEEPLGGDDDE
jgi:phage terminase small subunit